jgi:hypothetical protein
VSTTNASMHSITGSTCKEQHHTAYLASLAQAVQDSNKYVQDYLKRTGDSIAGNASTGKIACYKTR